MMRIAAALAIVALTSSIAAADPAPARRESPPRELDPYLAFGLSLGTTAAGYGAIAVGTDEHMTLTGTGFALITLGPSAGHWYQGRIFTSGLAFRAGGLLAFAYGVERAENNCSERCTDDKLEDLLAVAGFMAFTFGTVHDIISAPKRALATNAKNRQRFQNVTVAPQVGDDRFGFALAGSF